MEYEISGINMLDVDDDRKHQYVTGEATLTDLILDGLVVSLTDSKGGTPELHLSGSDLMDALDSNPAAKAIIEGQVRSMIIDHTLVRRFNAPEDAARAVGKHIDGIEKAVRDTIKDMTEDDRRKIVGETVTEVTNRMLGLLDDESGS